MKLQQFQVDAFTDQVFKGNPAGVVPLDAWLPDDVMQSIAMENNVAETAFFVPEGEGYRLRWFTPEVEVKLCGHATLGTAHILYTALGYTKPEIHFETLSGRLTVTRLGDGYRLDFPAQNAFEMDIPEGTEAALGIQPQSFHKVPSNEDDFVAVYASEAEIRALKPDFGLVKKLPCRGLICTAPGDAVDFVSRFFGPNVGIDEDPVTGSAHCKIAPYWSKRLGKTEMTARQLSKRGGGMTCTYTGDRVLMDGTAVTFLEGAIFI